jgi:hypothetical protein
MALILETPSVRTTTKGAPLLRPPERNVATTTTVALDRHAWMTDAGNPNETPFTIKRRSTMSATLKLTHKAIGAEIRRGTYDMALDGKRVGSVEMNDTFETPIEPGRHTLQVRNGRNSSRTKTFDAAEGEIVAFRCTGKSILPIFLASFVVPSLALSLRRE